MKVYHAMHEDSPDITKEDKEKINKNIENDNVDIDRM